MGTASLSASPPPPSSLRAVNPGSRPLSPRPRLSHRRAEPVLQQQVEAAQVAAAELGSLAGAGLSVGNGPHRMDDICRRRRGQAGRSLPAVLGPPPAGLGPGENRKRAFYPPSSETPQRRTPPMWVHRCALEPKSTPR